MVDLRRELKKSAHDSLAAALAPLRGDRDYKVIRDVLVHRGWVGHVVVCPGGIYVVEPVRWRGEVTIGRRGSLSKRGAKAAISAAQEDATRVRRRIASSGIVRRVGIVLALVNATHPNGPMDMREFAVVEAGTLPSWLRGRARRIQPHEVDMIHEVLTPHEDGPLISR